MDVIAVLGSTGRVGSYILSNSLASRLSTTVHTITRRALEPSAQEKLNAVVDPDTAKWASALSSLQPAPSTVYSAIGTTRATAGGIENQWKVDHDLNVELARAAKEAGVKTFVFISSGSTTGFPFSYVPFSKMKQGVEKTIRELGFENSVVLRLGLILGERDHGGSWGEDMAQSLTRSLPRFLSDRYAQDAEVGARAAIRAAQLASEGKAPSKHWVLEMPDIIRLGRDEWQTEAKAQE